MIAAIVPVYKEDFIYNLREQILDSNEYDFVDLWVVDNGQNYKYGGYIWEVVCKPDSNLRWTKGTNLGWHDAVNNGYFDYDAYVLLNDDVVLSPGFFAGLDDARRACPEAGLLAPIYDGPHQQQRTSFSGPAADWQPSPTEREARFVDGTCMLVTAECQLKTGYLDAAMFGEYGWGADYDYCIRAKINGFKVMTTERSYLNHIHQGTAKTISDQWESLAGQEMREGMTALYGTDWESLLW